MAGRAGVRMPVGCEIFRTGPHRPWGPPNLLHNGYRVSFPGVKRGVDHPIPSGAKYPTLPHSPLWSFVACSVVNFTFYLQQHLCQSLRASNGKPMLNMQLTKYMHLRPSLAANSCSAGNSPHFMEPKRSLTCSQQPAQSCPFCLPSHKHLPR